MWIMRNVRVRGNGSGYCLELLLRHERREKHIAEFHGGRDVRLRREYLFRLLAHEPLQALSVGPNPPGYELHKR